MEFKKTGWTTRLKRFALAVDSWVDAGLWGAARRAGDTYERIRSFTDRLTVTGGQRLARSPSPRSRRGARRRSSTRSSP